MDPNQAAWSGTIFVMVMSALGVAIVIVLIWQIFATRRARAVLKREDEYRKLAERATVAQEQAAQGFSRVAAELEDLRARVAEMERVLKEVE